MEKLVRSLLEVMRKTEENEALASRLGLGEMLKGLFESEVEKIPKASNLIKAEARITGNAAEIEHLGIAVDQLANERKVAIKEKAELSNKVTSLQAKLDEGQKNISALRQQRQNAWDQNSSLRVKRNEYGAKLDSINAFLEEIRTILMKTTDEKKAVNMLKKAMGIPVTEPTPAPKKTKVPAKK